LIKNQINNQLTPKNKKGIQNDMSTPNSNKKTFNHKSSPYINSKIREKIHVELDYNVENDH